MPYIKQKKSKNESSENLIIDEEVLTDKKLTLYKKIKTKSPTTAKVTKNIATGSLVAISAGVSGIVSTISAVTTSKFLNKCKNKKKLSDNDTQTATERKQNQSLNIEEINGIDVQNVQITTTENKLSSPQM